MESEQQSPREMPVQQRQTAFKVRVSELLKGAYVKEDGWLPNYIDTGTKKVSRANVIGIVIAVVEEASFKNILLDDGTGRISLRMFENMNIDASLGDVVLVIGRPREFGGERYIVPEILKKIDQKWFEVRKKELKTETNETLALQEAEEVKTETIAPEKTPEGEKEPEEEQVEAVAEESPVDKLLSMIRKIDSGSGALFEDISKESGLKNCEEYINKLLELGEIFEVRPGRFKVLE